MQPSSLSQRIKAEAYARDPRLVLEGARSAIVVAMEYGGREPSGPVARYARGVDYHDVMIDRLNDLLAALRHVSEVPVTGKAYVDTGPILERDLARRAGLGWFGKNTNLINPDLGSFFFLGVLLVDLDLEPDAPFDADRCGSCTRCLASSCGRRYPKRCARRSVTSSMDAISVRRCARGTSASHESSLLAE